MAIILVTQFNSIYQALLILTAVVFSTAAANEIRTSGIASGAVATMQTAIERIKKEGGEILYGGEKLDGGPVISQVVIPILETDDAARLAARLGPREHELIVATVDMMTRRRVECDGSVVRVDGDPLQRPFRLQEDGTLDETS